MLETLLNFLLKNIELFPLNSTWFTYVCGKLFAMLVTFPYPDKVFGVSMECIISIERSVHYNATPTLWSGIGVA